ncbi:PDZ domain-containing protein [Pseudoflavitalea sp. G-6-1-2]|uniref:PDZ domain-containing protein n=1 Tax=Pseudoflavitalea sp. G-6-1-2 TaxID=2728841 RepID=UPI00146BBCB8|nr:PDZ domain-containing protein [Pseudoflavitalea sp. G-6-1-2]NML20401.1 PDZ domain-containing protein [Pseudoflavitalea sp. G-6-1-2]
MKRYALAMALATATLLTGTAFAQESNDSKDKEQKDSKNKLKQYDELIIRKKSDKDEKITIEIKDGTVTINGKPMDEYDNENLSIRNARSGRIVMTSPFRQGRGGANSFEMFNDDRMGKTRPFLGVTTEEAPGGARITNISKGSAAEKAGLKEKDVIRKIDEEKVQDENDVSRIIRSHKPEDKVKILVLRDGKEQTITATLGQAKAEAQSFNYNFDVPNDMFKEFKLDELGQGFNFSEPRAFSFGSNGRPRIGIKAQDTENGVGVKVLDVQEGSVAEKAGIKEDDIITEFNGTKVNSADELSREVGEAKDKPKSSVKLLRDGKTVNLDILTPKKLKTANL